MFCERCCEVKEHSLCRDELHFECKECYNETKYDDSSKTYITGKCYTCNRVTNKTCKYYALSSESCSICGNLGSGYIEDAKLYCRWCEKITKFEDDWGCCDTKVKCKLYSCGYSIKFDSDNIPSKYNTIKNSVLTPLVIY